MGMRISQEPVEILVSPSSGKGRISHLGVEYLETQQRAKGRISHLGVEYLETQQRAKVRISYLGVEVLCLNDTAAAGFQAAIFPGAWIAGTARVR